MNRIAHLPIPGAGGTAAARNLRLILSLIAAAALALALIAAPRAAAVTQPAEITWSGSVSPALAAGSPFGVYNFTVTSSGPGFPTGPLAGHCLERTVLAASGSATLRSGADVAAALPGDLAGRIHWLLLSSRRSVAGPNAEAEAAAHQSAIWQLTDGPGTDTIVQGAGNAAVRDRAAALVAASIAGAATVGRAATIAPQGAAPVGGGTQNVLVTGAPFTLTALTITSANGTFAGGAKTISVDLGAAGQAVVPVAGAAGTVTIAGTAGASDLLVADFGQSQDFGMAVVTEAPIAGQLTFPAAPVPTQPTQPGVTGPTPGNEGVDRPASGTRLTITKTGVQTVTAGSGLSYRVRVCNAGKATARDVVVRYRIPRGMALSRRVPGSTVGDGVVTIFISTLRAGDCRSYVISLQVFTSTVGRRCGAATAVADNAGRVRSAQCCVEVARRPARRVPAVTG